MEKINFGVHDKTGWYVDLNALSGMRIACGL